MDIKTLEERIKARAAEMTVRDIGEFKRAVDKALDALCSDAYTSREQCIGVMASADNTKGWPKLLWEVRETQVRTQIFNTMDAVQRMLVSKGGGDEFTADEGTE